MLVGQIHIRTGSQNLQAGTNISHPAIQEANRLYLHDNIIFAILRSHMDEGVSPHVEGVRPCPPEQEQVHDAAVAMDAGVVKGREPMLVPEMPQKH